MNDNDQRLLNKWRAQRGDRYLTLAMAKELEKLDRRFSHLGRAVTSGSNTRRM